MICCCSKEKALLNRTTPSFNLVITHPTGKLPRTLSGSVPSKLLEEGEGEGEEEGEGEGVYDIDEEDELEEFGLDAKVEVEFEDELFVVSLVTGALVFVLVLEVSD